MTHSEVLCRILSNACSNPYDEEWNTYDIELCCVKYRILAKPQERVVQFEGGPKKYLLRELTEAEQANYQYTLFKIQEMGTI